MWQPIETAPKDQAFLAVLTCAGEQTICTMRWSVAEAKNSRPEVWGRHVERVTHWMPLPDLPGAQAQPAPSAPSVPEVTDAMALAFHHALTDGSIGAQEVEEIKGALRAALAAAPKPEGE